MNGFIFPQIIISILYGALLFASDSTFFNYLDQTPYYCKAHTDLDLSKEVFNEIANDVIGVEEYNDLIRLYKNKEWNKFKIKVELFEKIYETSPLIEAVTFLKLQVSLLKATTESDDKKIEQDTKKAFLLYPKSKFLPIIMANLANYWLKRLRFQKALSLYESLIKNYESHEFFCVFLYGAGESYFGLNSFELANKKLDEVSNKCKNRIIKVVARSQKASIKALTRNYAEADVEYKELLEKERSFIEKHFKEVLFQFAETKYQLTNYEVSRHLFNEFIRLSDRQDDCYTEALKRLADISLKLKESAKNIRSKYLVVHDLSPQSDIGKYSYLRSLLIDYKDVSPIEQKRRDQVLESKKDTIITDELKSLINLEYGLSKLVSGDLVSLRFIDAYLNENKIKFVDMKGLKNFISKEIVALAKREYSDKSKKSHALDIGRLSRLQNILEKWLSEKKDFEMVRGICSSIILDHVERVLTNLEFERAITLLNYWKDSRCWSKSGPIKSEVERIAFILLKIIYDEKNEEKLLLLSGKEEAFNEFLTSSYKFIWDALAIKLNKPLADRKLASINAFPSFSEEIKGYYWLTLGKIYLKNNDYENAIRSYNNVKSKDLILERDKGLAELYYNKKDYENAYKKTLDLIVDGNKEEFLDSLYHIIVNGKLWKKTHALVKQLKKLDLKEEEISTFYFLEGRAFFEEKNCDKSVATYFNALKVSPNDKASAEAKYRIGKCYELKRKFNDAKKIWQEVADMKDPVWSELATNELKLLSL